jgi:hypothetical protein
MVLMANNVTQLKRPVDPILVESLRNMLADAEAGTISGMVVLIACPAGAYEAHCYGDSDLGQMMLAFEAWKFRQLAARELEHGVR